MIIIVKAKPSSKTQYVELVKQSELNFGDGPAPFPIYKVAVKEPPVHGKSNAAIIKALADFFKVPANSVRLITGRASKQKFFEIDK
jgi:uncharacterized protein YggU (UPF0235/DUF167 family)